jgi:NAD(P)H-dependent flavin oxidoreductase YrpB (nitropropane dioxygenase family)
MNAGHTALDTPLRRMLGVDVPILQAGMGEGARAELVAAVSDAGGLGVLGGAGLPPDRLRDEIRRVRDRTDRPFGVNLVFPPELTGPNPLLSDVKTITATLDADSREQLRELLQLAEPGFVDRQVAVCLEEGTRVLVSGLGLPSRIIEAFHDAGGLAIAQVGTVDQARRMADEGADAVVASGSDAGGHTSRVGSLSLWAACADAIDLPIVASGGVVDGRVLAAAVVLGCQGVWVGTRFLVTHEAAVHTRAKECVVDAGTDDTMVTRAYSGKPMRVIRNDWAASWEGREAEILPFPLQVFATGGRGLRGLQRGDVAEGAVQAGQGLGLIHSVEHAGDVVRSMASEALDRLAAVAGGTGPSSATT